MKSCKDKPYQQIGQDVSSTRLQNELNKISQEPHRVEQDIFSYLNLAFKVNEIPINEQEYLHTVYISADSQSQNQTCFYLSHGFGGSSLMYFPVLKSLLQYGSVVLWEIRGMGFSKKLNQYIVQLSQTQDFFVNPIEQMLTFYKSDEIVFVSHSLGGYLTLAYIMRHSPFIERIKEVILLSPVGITPKEEDYKSQINGFSDFFRTIGNHISWKFHLTYKSPFRCLCTCLKNTVFKKAVQNCDFNQEEKQLMKQLLVAMVESKDGSESVFFNYFQPRVLPKFSIQSRFTCSPKTKITILYGGTQQDWVDKKGADRLSKKYSQQIQLKYVKGCGHNFPFFPIQLKKALQEILNPSRQVGESVLMQELIK